MSKLLTDVAEILVFVLVLFLVLHYGFPRYVVQGPSMEPTLTEDNRVIRVPGFLTGLDFWNDEPRYERQDIVIFDPPEGFSQDIVKRVVGVPGDMIDIREGQVYVNGVPELFESNHYTEIGSRLNYPLMVPSGEYFVLGDNRSDSSDSRTFGTLEEDQIQGRIWLIFWPLSAFMVI